MSANVRETVRQNPDVQVLVHRSWNELRGLRTEWNALVEAHPSLTLFQRYEWLESWWKTCGQKGRELQIVAVYDRNQLIGILPLAGRRRWLAFRMVTELEMLGQEISGIGQVIAATGREKEVLGLIADYFKARRRTWDVLRLRALPESAWPWWESAIAGRLPLTKRSSGQMHSLDFPRPGETVGPSAAREQFPVKPHRRRQRVLAGCRIQAYRGSEITPMVAAELEAIDRSGFRKTCRPSFFHSPLHRHFHWDEILPGALQSSVVAYVLYAGSQPAAYVYGFQSKDRMMAYCWNGHQLFRSISPDQFLCAEICQQVRGGKLSGIDFFQGNQSFKFHAAVHRQFDLVWFRSQFLKLADQVQGGWRKIRDIGRAGWKRWAESWKKTAAAIVRCRGRLKAGFRILPQKRGFLILQATLRKNFSSRVLAPLAGVEIRELKLKDIQLFPETAATPRSVVVERFWKLERCWGAVSRGSLVGAAWVAQGSLSDQGVRVALKKGELLLHDPWVEPVLRGQGLLPRIFQVLLQDLGFRQANCIKTLVPVESDGSLRALSTFHFKVAGRFHSRKIGWGHANSS